MASKDSALELTKLHVLRLNMYDWGLGRDGWEGIRGACVDWVGGGELARSLLYVFTLYT